MPPYAKHLEISLQRTGNDYQQMHDWLDNHPDHKAARHDLARSLQTGPTSKRPGARKRSPSSFSMWPRIC
jgi:hypothetical protein